MITLEDIEQGLFIGVSNKHYDELYKYYCYLKVLYDTGNVQKSNEDNEKINRLQKDLEFEKAHNKFLKEMNHNLQAELERLVNTMKERRQSIDKSN